MSEVSREFSDGTKWDNSIDWDDEPDGSAGGYTRNGNYIVSDAMVEIISLRQQSATMQARIEALEKAFNRLEASSIGPVTRMRETNRITLGYKEFCAVAALLEAEK